MIFDLVSLPSAKTKDLLQPCIERHKWSAEWNLLKIKPSYLTATRKAADGYNQGVVDTNRTEIHYDSTDYIALDSENEIVCRRPDDTGFVDA